MSHRILSTNNSLCFMLKFAQCFGMLPVCGISDGDCSSLKFKWTAKRTLYSMAFLWLAILNTFFQLLKMARLEVVVFRQYVTLMFFSVTIITVAIFIDVARKWPNLMRKWAEVDDAMKPYGFPVGLHKKLKIVAVVVMTAAIGSNNLLLYLTMS
ncbi:hypothetical protein MTP99_005736 [Tenebrio molitor]|nr:hypothetical protein MTP99_005736 [Tenebrio molitor]